jgi:2-C-methyl-D-erythritol 4-phosphate cytidylyltransferase
MAAEQRFWGVVPAAGSGSRLGGERPKQYLDLAGTPVLQRTLDALLSLRHLEMVMVALAPGDAYWQALPASRYPRVQVTTGGRERADSVLACLRALADRAGAHDWVLVHDAARPCLGAGELERLVAALADDPVGGLLAVRVTETVKRADADERVLETVDREALWLAQTPQMFRFGLLLEALESALTAGRIVTDESSALEQAGHRPQLVPGEPENIKITHPGDLRVAARTLAPAPGTDNEVEG